MRDLTRLDRGEHSLEPIKAARKRTEIELHHQLQCANSFLDVQKVMALVFEMDSSGLRTFLAAMLTAFTCDIDDADEDTVQVIQDSWNYFPHRSFNGRCPAEVMDEMMREDDAREKAKRGRQSN